MRKALTLLLGFTALVGRSQGLITLTNADQTANYNSHAVDVWGATADGQMSIAMDCVLNSDAPKQVNVRRYELSHPDGYTANSYCWGECYNSDTTGDHPVWYAPTTVLMYPATPFTGFDAYYDPAGQNGTASFRFVWFDNNAPNDSSWTDIVFHATAVGIHETPAADLRFNAFPVPSSTGRVEFTFDVTAPGQQTVMEFHDVLGNLLFTQPIAQGQQRYVLPAGKLEAGTWFASLRVDGRMVATRRVVVIGG